MTRLRYAVCVVVLLCGLSAFAQTAPLPVGPFPPPITAFRGRYLDSTNTQDFQSQPRTLRAAWTKSAPELDRLFMIIGGGTFASYRLSTFASRVATEPLATSLHGEKLLPPEMRVDPERPGSGWVTPLTDGQERLFDFDWDDRGNIYLAASVWGWGIVDLNGHLIKQIPDDVFALHVFSFLNGNTYYALVGENSTSKLYDVTNPSSPTVIKPLSFAMIRWAKANNGNLVAFITSDLKLHIADAVTLASGGMGTTASGTSWVDVTSDGTAFYGLARDSSTTFSLYRISSDLAGVTTTLIDTGAGGFFTALGYGAGYVFVEGFQAVISGPLAPRGLFYRIRSTPVLKTDASTFFQSTYTEHFLA